MIQLLRTGVAVAALSLGLTAVASAQNLTGIWRATGDFEAATPQLPAGGEGVGWAPMSAGDPLARMAKRQTPEEKAAGDRRIMENLAKIADQDLASRLGNPAAAPMPAATEDGAKAYKEFNATYNVRRHLENCWAPNVISGVTTSNFIVSQIPGRTIITYDNGFPRVIFTDGRDASEAGGSMFGYSIGHWEGRTFVVKTTNIVGKFIPLGMRAGWPISENITLTEWYALSDDNKTVTVKRVFEDPTYFKEPFGSASKSERTTEDLIISPCVEGLEYDPTKGQAEILDAFVEGQQPGEKK